MSSCLRKLSNLREVIIFLLWFVSQLPIMLFQLHFQYPEVREVEITNSLANLQVS